MIPPQTSIDAFRSLKDCDLKQTYNDILWALSVLNKATYQEIASFLKCDEAKIWKRLSELGGERFSLIHKTSETRKLRSGRMGQVWSLNIDTPIIERALPGKTIADFSRYINQSTTVKKVEKNLFDQ